jgi:isocitrate dehydrogenase (NAD+)
LEAKIVLLNPAEHFDKIIADQLLRIEKMKGEGGFVDYRSLPEIVIGICGGDGIGPVITAQGERVLRYLLSKEVSEGKIKFKTIENLTIEKRAECGKAIPDDVLAELKPCDVILKGPTTTPKAGDKWPNIESANVAMRKELDLFANVRPVKISQLGIDWVFFRENTEGSYAVGNLGLNVNDDLAIDFTITTTQGSERIIRLAFEYAKKTGRKRVDAVTKANIIKATDGKFLRVFEQIAAEYPDIEHDNWFVDIMSAKLLDDKRRRDFSVIVLPNLYGDILTDEAAEIQGGVGTAGSANIGKKYAMFEAIHGSAPRMVEEGRAMYSNPSSIMKACVLLLEHIGYGDRAALLSDALDICSGENAEMKITGRPGGATSAEFADYVMRTISGIK